MCFVCILLSVVPERYILDVKGNIEAILLTPFKNQKLHICHNLENCLDNFCFNSPDIVNSI